MKRMTPIKKYVDGGPGLSDRKWALIAAQNDPMLTEDLFTSPAVSTTPPGVGPAIDLSQASGPTSQPVATTGNTKGVNWQKLGDIGNNLAPYASNIINAFRRAPTPAQPIMDSPPVLQRVNLEADRVQVGRAISAANIGADRTLTGNTATAVRQYNMGQSLNELSKINERERNTNIGISNQQSIYNAQAAASNNAKQEDYNQSMVERNVAQQREQAANLANAADKYVAIQNEQRKANTDLDKARILKSVYNKSGVLKRQGVTWKAQGLPDPFGQDYKWLND